MTAVATKTATTGGVDRGVMAVFAGLMLGSLIASLNMTLVAPALPTIVAELGGLADYTWIPISAMLASTIVVPIAGKLSDVYGRKPLYMTGVIVFAAGSLLSGLAPNFWFLVFARFVQGAGMGFLMPLSQAIIGDIISPRERGKYQGMMGASFGLASIVGPAAGGFITQYYSWRWLFFVNQYPWSSWQIVSLYAAGAALLIAFAWFETRAEEPVLPLYLWKSSIFTFSNIASIGVAMAMFGTIFFLPVFVQGVIGNSVTSSGAILVPLLVAMIVTSIGSGQIISRTGRYKVPLIIGMVLMLAGYVLLSLLDVHATNQQVVIAMIVIGLGLGTSMQTYTLVVQNSVSRKDMAVATSATQLSRSIGAAVGLAVLGTILSQGMISALPKYLPPGAAAKLNLSGTSSAGALFDPAQLAHLPSAVAIGIRHGLADALHPVFLAGVPILLVALIATLFIREVPLRQTAHVTAGRPGQATEGAFSEPV
ncbi:MAG: MFS transporter [Chloroflexi bacterium]|nr:MAG: MFS transporter [Chloroflexota bacterium]